MPDYCVHIRLDGPLATPLHSGTIFGHLCWAMRLDEGEDALRRWLQALPGDPFLLSDALPAGYLPVPLLASTPRPESQPAAERSRIAKKLRRAAWMKAEDFYGIRDALTPDRLAAKLLSGAAPPAWTPHRLAHNTIDRHTGTTPEAGGLYFMDEFWPAPLEQGGAGGLWEVHIQASIPAEKLQRWFEFTGRHGFGRDAALGRGRFTASVKPAPSDRQNFTGNRLMSLSHGSLSKGMREPRYRLHTHYGKLGGFWASEHDPHKYPLVLLRPGATYAAGGGLAGELLGDVHPRRPEVVHNAWHLSLPYTEVEV